MGGGGVRVAVGGGVGNSVGVAVGTAVGLRAATDGAGTAARVPTGDGGAAVGAGAAVPAHAMAETARTAAALAARRLRKPRVPEVLRAISCIYSSPARSPL